MAITLANKHTRVHMQVQPAPNPARSPQQATPALASPSSGPQPTPPLYMFNVWSLLGASPRPDLACSGASAWKLLAKWASALHGYATAWQFRSMHTCLGTPMRRGTGLAGLLAASPRRVSTFGRDRVGGLLLRVLGPVWCPMRTVLRSPGTC